MLLNICVSLALLVFVQNVQCDLLAIRQTSNGPIVGIELMSSLGQKYVAFKGVRYAMPPITGTDPLTGDRVDRRFKAPESFKQNWTEPQMVQNYGKPCIPSSLTDNDDDYSEDCLFLNIYVPADGSMRKTVLVYIHGGSFSSGDATDDLYGPDFLLSQDNIVVTLQYRLGIFGFLNINHGEYSGNMGLKDQQMAIKWVYNNIEYFSGNKNEILLFGQDAGGASVNFHMLNDESRKYFNRAFAMSSSTFSSYVMNKMDRVQHLKEYSKINDLNDLIEYLKIANAADLNKSFQPDSLSALISTTWVPSIESPNAIDAFLTKTPDEVYCSDSAPIMDAMFSFTTQEFLKFNPDLLQSTEPLLKETWTESDPIFISTVEGDVKSAHLKKYQQAIEKLRDEYFPDKINITAIRNANIALMSDLTFSDSVIKATVQQTIANTKDARQKSQLKNVFLFRFSANTHLKLAKIMRHLSYNGASHNDEIPYIFHVHRFDKAEMYDRHLEGKDEVYDIIMRLVKIITNFARTGDPSIDGDTPFKSCQSENEIFCQEISNNPKSSVNYDIKKQLHYETWREIEKMLRMNVKGAGNTFNRHNLYAISAILFIHLLFRTFY